MKTEISKILDKLPFACIAIFQNKEVSYYSILLFYLYKIKNDI